MKHKNIFIVIIIIILMLLLVSCNTKSNEVTVEFVIDIDDTISISSIRHKKGAYFYLPSPPIRQGYIFWGWYFDESLSELFEDGSVVNENITLYSKWIVTDYEDLTLALNSDRKSFTVTGTPLDVKVIEIPESLYEYPITRIEQYAFKNKTNLEGIYIPASVSFIGERAFENCRNLTIYFKGSNAIGNDWNIHNRPVYFDFLAHGSNSDYDYIIHNEGYISIVKSIRRRTEVIIPDEIDGLPVHVIGNAAFAHNSTLESVEVPSTILTIENFAFFNCSNLSSILINGNTIVHKNSFNECLKATFYIRPSSLPSYWNIHRRPVYFDFLSRESNLEYDYILHNGGYISIEKYIGDEQHLVLPDEINDLPVYSIGNRAFENNSNLKSVEFSETLINIELYAFKGCYNLESIKINNINTLNKNAFEGCYHLNTLVLGKNINADIINTEISPLTEFLFHDLTSYAEIDLNEMELYTFRSIIHFYYFILYEYWEVGHLGNVDQSWNYGIGLFIEIFDKIFYDERKVNFDGMLFSNIEVDEGNEFMSSKDGVVYNHDMTTLLYYPPKKHESYFTLPESVKTINSMAFNNNHYIEEVILNEGLETIKINAFIYCFNLQSVFIPDSVLTIEPFAFMYLPNLTIHSKALAPSNNYMELWDFNTVNPFRDIEKYNNILLWYKFILEFWGDDISDEEFYYIFYSIFYDEYIELNYNRHNIVWGYDNGDN